ncbi:MAG TPA: esterase family protein, partial [Verrucomicrobiae bacterium]|nr:esterase family protein [Verrucomicrobiae bacterium]
MKTTKMVQAAARLGVAFTLIAGITSTMAALPPPRDPHTPGFVTAKALPDGAVPSPEADGNFIIGPTHERASEMAAQTNVPEGTVYNFTISSADSKIYPGIARERGTFGTPDPA